MKSKLIHHKVYTGIFSKLYEKQHIEGRFWDIITCLMYRKDDKGNIINNSQLYLDMYCEQIPFGLEDKETRYEESIVQFRQYLRERYLLIQSLTSDMQNLKEHFWNSFSWFDKIPQTIHFYGLEDLRVEIDLDDIRIANPSNYRTLKDFVDSRQKQGISRVYITRNLTR